MARAIIFDVGGVLLVPNRKVIAAALADSHIVINDSRLDGAHYYAINAFDDPRPTDFLPAYAGGYLRSLGVSRAMFNTAMDAFESLAKLPAIETLVRTGAVCPRDPLVAPISRSLGGHCQQR